MAFEFKKLAIPEVILVTPQIFGDERGFFMEEYKESVFKANGITADFVQDNHSRSRKDVVRGLHYQKGEHAQGKLVRVLNGAIWDVAVDIRPGSPTYLQWVAAELSDKNHCQLYIPAGFAHGFVALTDSADLLYKVTTEYCPAADAGIAWNDPTIGVKWPVANPILSEKDRKLPFITQADKS